MDALNMRERAYRKVEALRRDNKREKRRLDEKLFSKKGLAIAHKLEISALTEQQRKLKEELARIKTSSDSNTGLLPPRYGEAPMNGTTHINENPYMSFKRQKTENRIGGYRKLSHDSPRYQTNLRESKLISNSFSQIKQMENSNCGVYDEADNHAMEKGGIQTIPMVSRNDISVDSPIKISDKIYRKDSEIDYSKSDFQLKTENEKQQDDFYSNGKNLNRNRESKMAWRKFSLQPQKDVNLAIKMHRLKNSGYSEGEETNGKLYPIEDGFLISKNQINNHQNIVNRQRRNSHFINSINRRRSTGSHSLVSSEGNITNQRPFFPNKTTRQFSDENEAEIKTEIHGIQTIASENNIFDMRNLREAHDKIVRRLSGSEFRIKDRTGSKSMIQKDSQQLSPIKENKGDSKATSRSLPHIFTASEDTSNFDSVPVSDDAKMCTEDPTNQKKITFDSLKYNPDGSVRTVHLLPDFKGSLQEAMKARYVRHTEKQWFEKELSISDIFGTG